MLIFNNFFGCVYYVGQIRKDKCVAQSLLLKLGNIFNLVYNDWLPLKPKNGGLAGLVTFLFRYYGTKQPDKGHCRGVVVVINKNNITKKVELWKWIGCRWKLVVCSGVDFINILWTAFHTKLLSTALMYLVLTACVCIFFLQWNEIDQKLLVKCWWNWLDIFTQRK